MTSDLNKLSEVLKEIKLPVKVFTLNSYGMYEHKVKGVVVDSYRIIDNELVLKGEYRDFYLTEEEANYKALRRYEKDLDSLKYYISFVEQEIEKLTKE